RDASLVKPAEQPVRVIGLQPGQPTYRMLVVDDRWENRKMLARLLQMVGFDVREATQGSEAIDIWRTWRPHMIWMDMRMPVMDGYTATRQIKASPQGKTTVIIALTASAFEHERSRMLAAGCDDMIAKPFREATIFDKIQHYLRVRFLYEHLNHDTVASSHPAEDIFHPESLSTLSTEQIKQLYDAADRLDTRMVQRVIDDIQATQPALADALATAVRNYRFDIILEWIEQ
ncbi:MAG: response regulator, partial [Chloroflexaceae bacterium]|nr:response regulator [Chloroflexaceae bacterium]